MLTLRSSVCIQETVARDFKPLFFPKKCKFIRFGLEFAEIFEFEICSTGPDTLLG
jgi:hypothetical protein